MGRGTVFGGILGMGCMLFSERNRLMKLVECTFYIAWQVNVDCVVMKVLFYCETTVLGNGKISGDFVLSAKHIYEVVGVLFSFVFDSKVVKDKAESDGAPFVCEHNSDMFGLMVA